MLSRHLLEKARPGWLAHRPEHADEARVATRSPATMAADPWAVAARDSSQNVDARRRNARSCALRLLARWWVMCVPLSGTFANRGIVVVAVAAPGKHRG
jgi:hypothetical protein